MSVSANFFSVLGAGAALGRTFTPEEEQASRTRVVVLSDGFWRRRCGSDPSIVGRHITLNGEAHEVAGVMPQGFHVPGALVDFWLPRQFDEALYRRLRQPRGFMSWPPCSGVSLDEREEMSGAADLERQCPGEHADGC
jgi:hypothetical protein